MKGIPAGYRQTEVGVIPEDWDAPELGDILKSMQLGGNYKNSGRENCWPLIKMGNLGRGSIKLDKLEFIDSPQPPASRDRLNENDLLFNTRNTLDLVGKIAIWRSELPEAYYNSNIARMMFDEGRVSSYLFMNYIMNTPHMLRELRGIATGTTSVAAIYGRDLIKLRVPLPTKAEQEAIAEALSDTDALIESLEQLIAKKRQLKQGAMQELLTGKKRLPGFGIDDDAAIVGATGRSPLPNVPHGWEVKRFDEIVRLRKERIAPKGSETEEFCVELEHIEQGTGGLAGYTETSENSSLKSVFQKDDVLFGKLRAYLRKYWLANCSGLCSTEIWVLVAKRNLLIPEYLFQLVKADSFIEVASMAYGTHMPRSDWNVLKKYEIPLPPLPEQTAIAAILSDMDAEIAALETKLAKTRQLKQGMMHNLLTGKIRLFGKSMTTTERTSSQGEHHAGTR